ncbi:MAG: hypothetical protein V2I48_06920 [Xanthomonadales bacterium]|nr:hypothetical protein [Xanthomonadales bacterium]
MSNFRAITLILVLLFLTACAAPASREAMNISEADRVLYSDNHYLSEKVVVGTVSGGEDTNPAWTSEIGNVEFSGALSDSLQTARLLNNFALSEYVLNAELLEVDQPFFGLTLTVETKVHYQLLNKEGGAVLIDEVIIAEGTATTGDAFMGVKRLAMATERSAQESIKSMIDILYAYEP